MKNMNYYLSIKNERSQIFVIKDFKTKKLKLPKIKISKKKNIDISQILFNIFKINLNESINNYVIKDNLIKIILNSNNIKGIWLSKYYIIEELFTDKSKKYILDNKENIIISDDSKMLFAKIYCKTKLDIYKEINEIINYSINNKSLTGCYDGIKCFKYYYRNNSYNKYIRKIRENILQEFVNIYAFKEKNIAFYRKK